MKIFTLNDGIGSVEMLNSMGDDLTIVNSARVSYHRLSQKFEKKDAKLIEYLLKNKHTSPFEHVQFTFLVQAPLFIARQWMRHRTWSYNEVSRRYTSESLQFYVPDVFRKQSSDNKQMSSDETVDIETNRGLRTIASMVNEDALRTYNTLIKQGVAREQARIVLPVSLYTKFYATVDLHNLFNFMEIRDHAHSQWEMQKYAQALGVFATAVVPKTMNIWYRLKGE